MHEYRTKRTIAEGITATNSNEARVHFVEYQPGNGTRYVLQLTDLGLERPGSIVGAIRWIVTRLHCPNSGTVLLGNTGYLHWSYIGEKFGVSRTDAVVLTELIGYLIGRLASTTEDALIEDAASEKDEEKQQFADDDLIMP